MYSYTEDCQHTLLLIAHIGHAYWLSNRRCGWWMLPVWAPPLIFLYAAIQQSGTYVLVIVAIELQALWCHFYADYFLHN